VEPGDDRSGLGVVQAGDSVKDFSGVKGAFSAHHEDGKAFLLQLVLQDIAVGSRWFHSNLDEESSRPERAQDAQHGGILGRRLPCDRVQDPTVTSRDGGDHVDLGHVHGDYQAGADVVAGNARGLKLVDWHFAIDTLLHGDDLLHWFSRTRWILGVSPPLFFNNL